MSSHASLSSASVHSLAPCQSLRQPADGHSDLPFDSAQQQHDHDHDHLRSPPPQYPASEASASSVLTSLVSYRTAPPPFSSLFVAPSSLELQDPNTVAQESSSAPAYEPSVASASAHSATAFHETLAETKHALPRDTKGESTSRSKDDDAEPPPAYDEGYSPLQSFTYVMAAAGGAASIITQVQQGGPPINTLGGERIAADQWLVTANFAALDVGADETISMDLRYVQ